MAKKMPLVSLVVGVGLLGCSSMSGVNAGGCNPGGNCTVDVTVGAGCAISVSPDPLVVSRPRGAKSITWSIVTDGYEFAANGIAFKTANDEFTDPELNGRKFKWKDKHSRAGSYEYAVNVIRTGPNPGTCSKDPVVINE